MTSGNGGGLVVGDHVYLSEHVTQTTAGHHKLRESVRSHAVIAAQRQREDQVWVVVAGLNGTGTYLAATHLPRMRGTLPRREDPHPKAVIWGVVESKVDNRAMARQGQLPEPKETRFVVEPRLWNPETQEPIT